MKFYSYFQNFFLCQVNVICWHELEISLKENMKSKRGDWGKGEEKKKKVYLCVLHEPEESGGKQLTRVYISHLALPRLDGGSLVLLQTVDDAYFGGFITFLYVVLQIVVPSW